MLRVLLPIEGRTRVVVLTREGCHLCNEAINLVERHVGPGDWSCLDVDLHPALQKRFTDHVPVVFVDGRLLSYWTLPEARLADALAGEDWASPPLL